MSPVQIKRRRNTKVDPKQLLRAHVDQLPVEKQREFITFAFQLMAERVPPKYSVAQVATVQDHTCQPSAS